MATVLRTSAYKVFRTIPLYVLLRRTVCSDVLQAHTSVHRECDARIFNCTHASTTGAYFCPLPTVVLDNVGLPRER